MIKKLIFPKHLKKIFALILMALVAVVLSSCDSSNRKPTGSLDRKSVYASGSGYSITVGELYDQLRYNSVSYIENETYKFLYDEEIKTVQADTSKYEEKFNEVILNAIYGTSDDDEIEEMKKTDPKSLKKSELTYIDTMYQQGYKIDLNQIQNREFETLYPYYYLDVAKYVAAYNELVDEVKKDFTVEDGKIVSGDVTDDSYFTESDVISYYEDNHEKTGYVEGILIRFVTKAEADDVLKAFGIKAYNGNWYQIPRDEEKFATKLSYDEYYDSYSINPSNGVGAIEINGNGKATILKIFAEIYNYIYAYEDLRPAIVLDENTSFENFQYSGPAHLKYYSFIEHMIRYDHENYGTPGNTKYDEYVTELRKYDEALGYNVIKMDNERLQNYNNSLASYIYNTLSTKAASEDSAVYVQYSASARTYGNYSYLIYKISEEEIPLYEEVPTEEETDEDDEKEIQWTNDDLKYEILTSLFEEKLDDSYISEIYNNRIKKAKLKIFDSQVELQFMYSSSSPLVSKYEKTKKSNNNLVASVKYKGKTLKISVKDVYNYFEPLSGPQTALNLLFKKYIKTTHYYTDLNDQYDGYVESIENMLYYFANDYYASYGYPSTMGKYNFMMMYFQTANIKKAVQDFLMLNDAQTAFFKDFSGVNADFYQKLTTYANKTQTDYYSLSATGINVYADKDEDGKHDEMDDFTKGKANELLELIALEVKNSHQALATALSTVISDYNASSRLENTNPTESELKWSEFRRLGLYVESITLDGITNSTTNQEEVVLNRMKELYAEVVDEELGFISSYLDTTPLDTKEGQMYLLVTAGSKYTSAKFEDEDNLYNDVIVEIAGEKVTITFGDDAFSSDLITEDQVKVYVSEYLIYGDVYSLPNVTTTALDAYVLPLIQKYNSSASQFIQIKNKFADLDFKLTTAVNPNGNEAFNSSYTRADFLNNYIETLKNSAVSYDFDSQPDWWENMYE